LPERWRFLVSWCAGVVVSRSALVVVVAAGEFGAEVEEAPWARETPVAWVHPSEKPQRRANQREEEAIEYWKEERWPSLKRGHERKAGP
jgi:hypothetical protein